MGLLEKERVLYFLIFFGCLVSPAYAADNRFFSSKVDYFSEPKQACSSCRAQEDMNNTVEKVLSKTKSSFQLAQGGTAGVTLFLDPSCRYSDLAIKSLAAFIGKHPDFTIKVFVNGPMRDFLSIGQDLMKKHPNWAVISDITGGNAHNWGVSKAPAYIFTYQGRSYRIYGTPGLEKTWEKINVSVK